MAKREKGAKGAAVLEGPEPVIPLPELPDGWIWANMTASKGWGVKVGRDEEPLYHQTEPVYVAVPVTREAQVQAFNYVTTFETPEGDFEVEGPEAATAQHYFGGYEGALRGPVRDEVARGATFDPESLQLRATTERPFQGRGGGFKIEEKEFDKMTKEDLKKLLRAKGRLA